VSRFLTVIFLAIPLVSPLVWAAEEKATPKQECEKLLDAGMRLVEKLLKDQGEYYPVAFYMKPDGSIVNLAAFDGKERPSASEVIQFMEKAMAAMAVKGEVKAIAVLYDVRIVPPGKKEKQDAVAVDLEHRDGYQITVFYPYSMEKGKPPHVEEPFSVKKDRKIFPDKAKP